MAKVTEIYEGDMLQDDSLTGLNLYGECTYIQALELKNNALQHAFINVQQSAIHPMVFGCLKLKNAMTASMKRNNSALERKGIYPTRRFFSDATNNVTLAGFTQGASLELVRDGKLTEEAKKWLPLMVPSDKKYLQYFSQYKSLDEWLHTWLTVLRVANKKAAKISVLPKPYTTRTDKQQTRLAWSVFDPKKEMAVTTGRYIKSNGKSYVEAYMIKNAPHVERGLLDRYKSFRLPLGNGWQQLEPIPTDVPEIVWFKLTSSISIEERSKQVTEEEGKSVKTKAKGSALLLLLTGYQLLKGI